MGRKAGSARARALSDEGEVVHDLLKPGTGNNLPSTPLTVSVGAVGAAFEVEVTNLEDNILMLELEEDATGVLEVEEACLVENSVTGCKGGIVADGVADNATAAGQDFRRTGRAWDKTAKIAKCKITLIALGENMSIKSGCSE